MAKGKYKHPPESLRNQTPSVAAKSAEAKHKGPPIIPGVNDRTKSVKPPPPPARTPPSPPQQPAGDVPSSSRPEPPELPGAAPSAPNVDRSRSRTQATPQIDYSCLLDIERTGFGAHHAADVINGFHPHKITIGLDWHRVISPYGVDRYNFPWPLFVVQLRELAQDYDVQFWVVSFTGYSGARQAKDDISTFVAACVSIHQLPFCGYRITKSPIGPNGKAAIIPDLRIQIFVDDRADIVNEIKRTGIQVHLATGESTVWVNDLLAFFKRNDVNQVRTIVATPLRPDQFSKEPPGRRGY